jgi:hypothetical protein
MPLRKVQGKVELFYVPEVRPKSGLWNWLVNGSWNAPEPSGPPKGHIRIVIGSLIHHTEKLITATEFQGISSKSAGRPIFFGNIPGRGKLWKYHDSFFWSEENLGRDDVEALLKAREIRTKQSIDRAKTLVGQAPQDQNVQRRGVIPADLRILVWERDQGTCVDCGSSQDLQFDHIIPVSMGGGTSEDNLQILCGPCNRGKGASLA